MALDSVVFVVVGVILAAIAIVGGAVLDRSFRFPLDIEYGLGLPVLSVVPDIRPISSRLAFRRSRSAKPASETVGRKITKPLSDDEVVEAAA
jgi:hypothetical protein